MNGNNALQSNRSARNRRCAKCQHVNPASYLVCRECSAILTNSEWVDTPVSTLPKLSRAAAPGGDKVKRFVPEPSAAASTASGETITPRVSYFKAHTTGFFKKVKPEETKAAAPVEDAMKLSGSASSETEAAPHETPVSMQATVEMPKVQPEDLAQEPIYVMPPASAGAAAPFDPQSTLRSVPVQNRKFKEGTPVFEPTMILSIEISKSSTPIVLRLPQKRALIFGRDDSDAMERPDIDLIPYGGYQLGISRRHAALELNGKRLTLRDLKSSNGTYLNDVLLDPYEPHQLRDGDKVRLGSLVLSIYFQQ